MRILPPDFGSHDALPGLPGGIYPYVGGSARADGLESIVRGYGYAAASGAGGVRLASRVQDILVDPARYALGAKTANEPGYQLFEFDEWLERQRQAKLPVILTDSTRIQKHDRESLRAALRRWQNADDPTLVVLPVETWWLKGGLPSFIEEVRSANRPVGIVLHHHYNALDEASAVAGLVAFLSALRDLPVVLLRCDVSGIGAVAHGGRAAFIGLSASNRHGPMPRGPKPDGKDDDPDMSPAVFVPALHDYVKASKLPSISGDENDDVLACDDSACCGTSLLRLARLSEVDLKTARSEAYRHNMASHERVAQLVFSSNEPKDAWWELCKSGADTTASLVERGISLPVPRWLRQWLELGSPAHDPVRIR